MRVGDRRGIYYAEFCLPALETGPRPRRGTNMYFEVYNAGEALHKTKCLIRYLLRSSTHRQRVNAGRKLLIYGV